MFSKVSPAALMVSIVALSGWAGPLDAQGVVINEIDYNPADGGGFEFVELANTTPTPLDVSNWTFERGIRYTLPPGTVIGAGDYLVVARFPNTLSSAHSIPAAKLVGGFQSSLDNGGETLVLVDDDGVTRDLVTYDNRFPWPEAADGAGGSLERICPSTPGTAASNWGSNAVAGPTPGLPNNAFQCPPPPYQAPRVVINEIFYHAENDDDDDGEYVELRNTTDDVIDLTNWSIADGFEFTFPPGTLLEPQGLIVVARNAAAVSADHGVANVVGDAVGGLSNSGERIEVADENLVPVDAVTYSDHGDWPAAPDGLGFSLEKVVPTADGSDPAAWRTSSASTTGDFQQVEFDGAATSSRVYIYLEGEAEALIDNLSITRLGPGTEHVPGGDFNSEGDLDGWTFSGNHDDTRWQPTGGTGNSGCVRLVARARGGGSSNSMNRTLSPSLTTGARYLVRFQFKLLSGSTKVVLRLSGSTTSTGLYGEAGAGTQAVSPGKENGARLAALPPFVSRVEHSPRQPRSSSRTVVTCRVRGSSAIDRVDLTYDTGSSADTVVLRDDGSSGDGLAGDGIYGARLQTFPHSTLVRYTIEAADTAAAVSTFPPPNDPTTEYAFYVNNQQPDSVLPVYHLLASTLNIGCSTYRSGHFIHDGEVFLDVGVRNRGGSQCGQVKRNLKVRFNRGRYFQGKRKINMNSLWPDKSLIRDKLSWDLLRDQNHVYCESFHVRVHHNGSYHGLFLYIENPDKFYLDRNGLDPDGNLYKSVASREDNISGYEKKTNEHEGNADLVEFINALGSGTSTSLNWLHANIDFEWELDYQTAVVGMASTDHAHKNHYLYHDPATDLWRHTLWDLELTWGAFWDGSNGGLYNDEIDPFRVGFFMGEGGNRMTGRFFGARGPTNRPYFDRALYGRLWAHFREKIAEPVTDAKAEELRDLLQEEQAEDIAKWGRFPTRPTSPNHPPDFNYNVDELLDIRAAAGTGFLRRRLAWLRNQLNAVGFNGFPWVRITEIMYNPEGTSENLEFLEVHNTENFTVDVSGWYVDTLDFEFPADSELRPGETAVISKNPALFTARYGSVGKVFGPYPGNLANNGDRIRLLEHHPGSPGNFPPEHPITIDIVVYDDDAPWPTLVDGSGRSLDLIDVELDNDYGRNWMASAQVGGSPGRLPGQNAPPAIDLLISATVGAAPLTVTFDASGSFDPDGDAFTAGWDLGDGNVDVGLEVTHTYNDPGLYQGAVGLDDGINAPNIRTFEITVLQSVDDQQFRRGDTNGDRRVDLADAVRLLRGLFGGLPLGCRRAADTDDDGRLLVTDAVVVLEYLFRNGAPLPAPFPSCGHDFSVDPLDCDEQAVCN